MHVYRCAAGMAVAALAAGLSACSQHIEPSSGSIPLDGQMFPALVVTPEHAPASDCDQVRAKRVDELDPNLRQMVDRISFQCTMRGDVGLSTDTVAHLTQGRGHFLSIPVSEIRVSESAMSWESQYLLAWDYSSSHIPLRQYLESLLQEDYCVGGPACSLDERYDAQGNKEEGLTLSLPDQYRIAIYPDRDHPGQTIYARQWRNQDRTSSNAE